MTEFADVWQFAVTQHQRVNQQYRHHPYSFHLQQVVNVLETAQHQTGSEISAVIIQAAICHDLLEDTGLTYNDLSKVVGVAVADVVYDVTNELGKNRTDRAERTYPKIAANPAAIVVKLADRIANTEFSRDAGSSMWRKYVAEYPKFRHWLYQFWQFESYPEMSVLWDRLDQANPEMSLLWDRSVESTAGRGWLL